MKKRYTAPAMDIVLPEQTDILCTSGEPFLVIETQKLPVTGEIPPVAYNSLPH